MDRGTVNSKSMMLPELSARIYPDKVEIMRESILLDRYNQPIPMSQVMPKYIPKEPTKACVSSPLGQSLVSSRNGSTLFTDVDSDACSLQSQCGAINTKIPSLSSTDKLRSERSRMKRNRKSKKRPEGKVKTRPVNVVGPIVSLADNSAEKEEVFSASGAESLESEGDNQILIDELTAQKKLIKKLEEDLSNQLKVNSDLKKLLVASVGSDLEYRVEKLAQDKAQLSATVGSYSARLYKDVEDLDRVSIQADMWRSKYMASRVQAEELSQANFELTNKYTEATTALQSLLEERSSINSNLIATCRLLNPSFSTYGSSYITTLQLSEDLLSVSSHLTPADWRPRTGPETDSKHYEQLTKAESAAYTVLSAQMIPQSPLEVPHSDDIPRYPSLLCQTRSSHKNCACRDCQSELVIV